MRNSPAHETLVNKCVSIIATNFVLMPVLDRVPTRLRERVLKRLPADLDLSVGGTFIHDESYWRRRCTVEKKWKDCIIADHGYSWKQTFFERNLQDVLERFGDASDQEEVIRKIRESRDYVFSLTVSQLLTHPDLSILFDNLHNLTDLSLTYGVKRLRLRYNRALFGMKSVDAESLANCLKTTNTLCRLSLTSNLIDDDLLEILMSGLGSNSTVTHLDLSHNSVSDLGVQILSDILGKNSILSTLILSNNQIGAEGGRVLGHLLSENRSLTCLDLRLNRLGDIGAAAIFKATTYNKSLRRCNLGSNAIGFEAASTLRDAIASENFSLQSIDLSANDFVDSDVSMLLPALRSNRTLVQCDLRMNKISQGSESLSEIASFLRRNEEIIFGAVERDIETGESKGK